MGNDFSQHFAFVSELQGMNRSFVMIPVMCLAMGLVLPSVLGCMGKAPLAPKALSLNEAGVEALARGDLLLAEARFALALEYHPRFVDALVNLGLLEMERGNFELARQRLEEAVSINRHLAQPHHGLGLLAERSEQVKEAAEHYREALKVDPGFVPARANLARLHFEAGQLDFAREQFLRMIQVAPDDPNGYAGLADSLYRLGRDHEAEQVVAEAVSFLGSEAPALRIHLARIELKKGNIAAAVDWLFPLTKMGGPSGRDGWAWLAMARLMEGQARAAINCAERALEMERNHPLATYVLAMGLTKLGDPSAPTWLKRAQELGPDNSVLSYVLAQSANR